MITTILDDIKNHFIREHESPELTFSAEAGTISGSLDNDYLAGQYIYIIGSILNDGAYKITEVGTNELEVDGGLTDETSDDCYILGLAVPKPVLSLVAEIESWVDNNAGTDGIASESIDGYSVSFDTANGSDGWKSAFRGKLARYRHIYNDLYDFGGGA